MIYIHGFTIQVGFYCSTFLWGAIMESHHEQ